MNEREESLDISPDPVLDKHLLGLQRFTPKAGFEDRVMARVRIPAPALVRVQTRVRRFASPARLWWASGLAAAGSAAWTVALATWLSALRPEVVMAWLSAQVAQPLWTAALQAATLGPRVLGSVLSAYQSLGNALFLLVAGLMLLPVLSSWGLYTTMKQPRGKRVMAYAA